MRKVTPFRRSAEDAIPARPVAASLLTIASLSACGTTAPAIEATGLAGAQPVPPAEQSLAIQCSGDAALQQQMSEAVNAARANGGKTILGLNASLTRIAQSHACDVAAMGRASVAGSNGSNVVDRARAVGYPTCGVVQMVSAGGTPPEIIAGWLGSEAHREQVLGQLSEEIGSGVARGPDGRMWWSVVLGNDCR